MGCKRTSGLRKRGGVWHIDKQIFGQRIHQSTGTSSLKEAQLILGRQIEEIRQATVFGIRPTRTFREAATRYLNENLHLSNIIDYASRLEQLDSYIGDLPLTKVHMGTLKPYIDARRKNGIKTKTINNTLGLIRRILNLSARLWRDDQDLTWLETAPLIQLMPVTDATPPYPLSWEEQDQLFQKLPDHLAKMCLFKVNTGCREQEACQLRWDWEVKVPQFNTSVFLVPSEHVKNREERLVVLNTTAISLINSLRGHHETHVFSYKGAPLKRMNTKAYQRVRESIGFKHVRIHDLKHTFGRRLRAAGVPLETRKVLLGHRNGDITTHYSAPELEELINAANLVCRTARKSKSGKTPALVVLKRKTVTG